MLDKLIFRSTTIFLILFPLYLLHYGKLNEVLLLEISSFMIFSIFIITGIHSFNKDMILRMSEKESYVENIFIYAFNHQVKFAMMIMAGLTFSYYGYDIFAFLVILGGAGEAYMNYNVKQIHLSKD